MTRRATLLTLAGAALAYSKASRLTAAFHYAAAFSKRDISWYSRFELLVTGGFLSPSTTKELLQAGCRLIAYEWSSAFYPGDSVSAPFEWQSTALAHGREWLLNSDPTCGGAAVPGRVAYWYDFASAELREARAEFLAKRILENGYSGVFLDTLGFEQLPAAVRDEFRRRHPDLDYNHCQGEFLRQLRACLGPSPVIFTNQGYRSATDFLACADYDLSESAFTLASGGQTIFRAWDDAARPWDSIFLPMNRLILPAATAFPHVRFVHLNYAEGDPSVTRRAILYSYAAAKLWNQESYLVPADAALEENPVYFSDLGKPLTGTYQVDASKRIAWREFENATVVLASDAPGMRRSVGRVEIAPEPSGYVIRR